jgi:Concanavalin A-like lectin/glucanases superfamily
VDGIGGPQQKGDAIDQKLAELKAQRAENSVPSSDPGITPIDVDVLPQGSLTKSAHVDAVSAPHSPETLEPEKRGLLRPIGITLIVLSLIVAGLFALANFGRKPSGEVQLDAAARYTAQASPAPALTAKLATSNSADTLTVNGQLSVTGSLVVNPSVQPTGAVAGELYYDSSKDLLGYYNGTTFIYPQGGGSVTNNVTNNSTTNNITNVTNATGGSAGITGSGTAGSLAVFTGPGTLGDSLINQNGSSLNTGSGVENVILGSENGASTTALQGGTGGLSLTTGNASASASGNIILQSGDSSATAAGNISIDSGVSTITGVTDADFKFENISDVNDFEYYNGFVTISQDCTVAHGGSCSLNVTGYGTGGGSQAMVQQDGVPPGGQFPVTPGHKYVFSMWVRAKTTPDPIYGQIYGLTGCDLPVQNDTTTQWTNLVWSCTAGVGQTYAWFIIGFDSPTTVTHYFDDVTATDVSSSSAISELNLGASNAQQITLGNSNELGPTAIYGGTGISLTAGLSPITASGGSFSVTGNSNSSVSTTNGNLSLTAGGGNLLLQGGSTTNGGSGPPGSVIVEPGADSAQAFQVKNAAGNTALAVNSGTGVLTLNTASSCSYASYSSYIASLSPTAYWKLEDVGGTATDSSGNNNNGTLSNVTTGITPGPFTCANTKTAMSFSNPSNSQITTADTYNNPATYSQVAMFKATGAGTIVGFSDGGANYDRQLFVGGDGKLYARIYNGANEQIGSSQTVTDGSWHIAVVTESGAGLDLYIDGTLVASNTAYYPPQSYSGSWSIGNLELANGYSGDISEVAIIPSALTPLQVQTLATYSGFYNATLAAIGVGTTTPSANLDVEGTGLFKNGVNSNTAFQVQDASGADLVNVATNTPTLVNDSYVSNAPTGTFVRGSSWVSGQYVELNNGGPGNDGEVNYQLANVGNSLNASFDFWSKTGGGDGTFFYAYDHRTPATFHLGTYYGGGGYIFSYGDNVEGPDAGIYYDGTLVASAPITPPDNSAWHTAQIVKSGSTMSMYLDGVQVLTYTDPTVRDLSGTNFGVGGCSCSNTGEHRATNFILTGDQYITTGGSTELGGNVDIPGTLSGGAIETSQLTTSGSLIFKPWTDSTSAFEIQNAYDTPLLTADTTDMTVTVQNLTVSANLTVSGHIITGGATPTYTVGTAANCSSAGSVTITGNDTSGTVSITTGSSPCSVSGLLATVKFAVSFGTAPHITLTPGGSTALALGVYADDSTVSTTSFDIDTNSTPAAGTTYQWNYLVTQ